LERSRRVQIRKEQGEKMKEKKKEKGKKKEGKLRNRLFLRNCDS
jgi:hypothetical protein